MSVILRPNATPVYGFLSFIRSKLAEGEPLANRMILDCGAGGPLPPLSLFREQGLETFGIDISEEQLERARTFCRDQGIEIGLMKGDMRRIPFRDGIFDHVYEQYSMCHLSKPDIAGTVREMFRVLKPGGSCFLGLISWDTWPRSLYGEEREPGEFYGEEGEEENIRHSLFSDGEAERVVSGWTVEARWKRVRFLDEIARKTSLDSWMELYDEATHRCSLEEWGKRHPERESLFRSVHLFYYLSKPE
jgi:ubiquinone/menaquinone biosynthesis C-methylase UbiE